MGARYALLVVIPGAAFASSMTGSWTRKRDAIRDARSIARQNRTRVGVYRLKDRMRVYVAEPARVLAFRAGWRAYGRRLAAERRRARR